MEDYSIMVSVCCLAYNHEKYIRKCLDGFVMQKTNFKYEVLIHDDASTDHTADIIREYEAKYPEIIKPIYQVENQYSQGVDICAVFQYPRARGKYIAACEGDDYWIDEKKLQKQVDFLERHPEIKLCCHRAVKNNLKTGEQSLFPKDEELERDFDADEMILKGGGYFATCSDLFRREDYISRPSCFAAKGFGDIPLRMWGAINGGIHYFPEVMAVYNYASTGSWTNRVYFNPKERAKNLAEHIRLLKSINKYYNYEYNKAFCERIRGLEYARYICSGNILGIHQNKYSDLYSDSKKNGYSPDKECIANAFPWLVTIKRKLLQKENQT